MSRLAAVAGYLWAAPYTAVGLLLVPVALLSGGGVRAERGAVEVFGGLPGRLLRRGSALCLGHVILGRDRTALDHARDHEHVHVRQYARWGPLAVPAYLLAGFLAWRRGGHWYWDNPFEREAYGLDP